MHVGEVMTKRVFVCYRNQSLDQAARLLWDHDVGAVPVVDDNLRPLGMLTDRDLCMAAYTQGKPLHELQVASAMSRQIFSCAEHDTVQAAARIMSQHQVRRLPVVNDMGMLIGMLSVNDIVLAQAKAPRSSVVERLNADTAATLVAISKHRADTTAPRRILAQSA